MAAPRMRASHSGGALAWAYGARPEEMSVGHGPTTTFSPSSSQRMAYATSVALRDITSGEDGRVWVATL
jgi:hypothetical protein